jgi:catechol 2,3-dioxygenase
MKKKPGIGVGHVHLTVSNLERSIDFYTRLVGMNVMARYGSSAAFLSFDGYHHHLGLNTWEGEGVPPQLEGAADHGVSEAIYLRDPDNIGIELYWDRPSSVWPRKKDGNIDIYTKPLDIHSLLSEL